MGLKEIIFLSIIVSVIHAEHVSYDKYKVYQIVPTTENEVQILMDVEKQQEYMFWSDIISINSDVQIMVAPEKQSEFEKYFKDVNLSASVVIDNVQEKINNQLRRPASRNINNYAFDYYLTTEEIFAWLDRIAAEHPDVVTLVSIGNSNEERPIRGVKIDFKKQNNPVIGMIEGGIHAREWISPATVTFIINQFLTSTDPQVRFVAENIVWHIFPVVNPDGYSYTFTNNRMWRKNRSQASFTNCTSNNDLSNGVDLNRNFGFVWMSIGATQNPCGETFAGPAEFSEPESRAIRQYVLRIQGEGRMIYYFAFHSYGQMALVPYSHAGGATVLEAANYADMFEIAVRGMDKLEAVHGTSYRVGTSLDILYAVSGSSFDWAKGVANVPISFLFELRDTTTYGFLLPPDQIIPNSQEIVAGLLEIEKVTRGMGYYQISSAQRVLGSIVIFIVSLVIAL